MTYKSEGQRSRGQNLPPRVEKNGSWMGAENSEISRKLQKKFKVSRAGKCTWRTLAPSEWGRVNPWGRMNPIKPRGIMARRDNVCILQTLNGAKSKKSSSLNFFAPLKI